MPGKTRVALIESSTHTRRALAERLETFPGTEVAWAVATIPMAVRQLADSQPLAALLVDSVALAEDPATFRKALGSPGKIPVFLLQAGQDAPRPDGPWAAVISKPVPGQALSPDWPEEPLKALLRGSAKVPAAVLRPSQKPEVVLLGMSTGGPTALETLAQGWPEKLAAPILIVQHVMAGFDKSLVDNISRRTRLAVALGHEGKPILPGTVTVAPAGRHMVVRPGPVPVIGLDDGPPEQSCKPAVNPLFRSAALVYGARALAVVMTGMGVDGFDGVLALKARGAGILAQDQATSVVWGMPGAVARAGLADLVLPLGAISGEICLRAGMAG